MEQSVPHARYSPVRPQKPRQARYADAAMVPLSHAVKVLRRSKNRFETTMSRRSTRGTAQARQLCLASRLPPPACSQRPPYSLQADVQGRRFDVLPLGSSTHRFARVAATPRANVARHRVANWGQSQEHGRGSAERSGEDGVGHHAALRRLGFRLSPRGHMYLLPCRSSNALCTFIQQGKPIKTDLGPCLAFLLLIETSCGRTPLGPSGSSQAGSAGAGGATCAPQKFGLKSNRRFVLYP